MRALVIGYGSIGQRHVRLLKYLNIPVSVVSRRKLQLENTYSSLSRAFKENNYQYIVIANETASHITSLQQVKEFYFEGSILVEKPLFMQPERVDFDTSNVFVAYNLRFHPLLSKLKEKLVGEQVVSVNAYVGQYLPSWRPETNYSESYSAIRKQGGGVLRDLSHELDYLTMLFGEWQGLVSEVGKFSNLNIETEDYVSVCYVTNQNIRIAVELNYLDRITQRYITIQTNNKTIKIDFISNSVNCNGKLEQLPQFDRDYTYIKQHEDMLDKASDCCSYIEGMKVVNMIEAIEKSSRLKEWVYYG